MIEKEGNCLLILSTDSRLNYQAYNPFRLSNAIHKLLSIQYLEAQIDSLLPGELLWIIILTMAHMTGLLIVLYGSAAYS